LLQQNVLYFFNYSRSTLSLESENQPPVEYVRTDSKQLNHATAVAGKGTRNCTRSTERFKHI